MSALAERPAVQKLMKNARAAGARLAHHGKGAKQTGKAAMAGGLAAVVIDQAENNVATLRSNWYIAPILGIVGGHMLAKKDEAAGYGVVGASSAMFVAGYRENQMATPAAAPVAAPAPAAAGLPNAGRIANKVFNPARGAAGLPNAGRIANRAA